MSNLTDIVEDELTRKEIQVLMLEVFTEALIEGDDIREVWDSYRKRVLSL